MEAVDADTITKSANEVALTSKDNGNQNARVSAAKLVAMRRVVAQVAAIPLDSEE